MAAKLQAPRGTFDVLPADGRRRAALARTTDDAARPRGLRAVREPGVRGHRAVRARGGGGHRHRAQGDVHLRGQGGPLAHAPSRGHRGRLPRVRGARHAQAAAAGEAPLLGPVLPPRGAAGRAAIRQFTQIGRRGARLRRPLARRRDRAPARGARRGRGRAGPPGAAVEPRHAGDPRGVPGGAGRLPARARVRALGRRARPARQQPAARVRRRPPGHPRGDGGRAAAARPARAPTTPSTSPRCAPCSTTPGSPYEVDTTLVRGLDYYTRTVFEVESGRARGAERARRRRALRPAGGAARRARARRAWASRPGWSASCWPPRRRTSRGAGGCSWRWPSPTRRAPPSRSRGGCASAACGCELEQAGRSLKGQLKQADRIGARATVIVGGEHRGQGHGHRRADRRPPGRRRRSRWWRARSSRERAAPQPLPHRLGRGAPRRRAWASACGWPAGCTAGATTAGSSSSTCATAAGCSSSSSARRRRPRRTPPRRRCAPRT